MKAIRKKLYAAKHVMEEILKKSTFVKINAALIVNSELIKADIETLQAASKQTSAFEAYDVQRKALCEQYCEKGPNGKPVVQNNTYVGLEDNQSFETAMSALQADHRETIDAENARLKQVFDMMDEEVELPSATMIKLDSIPDGLLTGEQQAAISMFIKGT